MSKPKISVTNSSFNSQSRDFTTVLKINGSGMMVLYTNIYIYGTRIQLFIDSVMMCELSGTGNPTEYLLYYQIQNNKVDYIRANSNYLYSYAVPINALTFQSSIELLCGILDYPGYTVSY